MYPAECGEQLGRDPSKIGSSKIPCFVEFFFFSGEGNTLGPLTLWDTPVLSTPPLSLLQFLSLTRFCDVMVGPVLIWRRGKDPHPQDFSLPKKTARFTKGQSRPY